MSAIHCPKSNPAVRSDYRRRDYAEALIDSLAQTGCTFYEEHGSYQPAPFVPEAVQHYERLKREFLQLEDIKVGDGPIAASGRKVTADISVRYSDGTLIYQGPAVTYWGRLVKCSLRIAFESEGSCPSTKQALSWD